MSWVSSDAYCAALSRGHGPAEPERDEDYRVGELIAGLPRTTPATAGCRSPGANWVGKSSAALALPGIACPLRATASPPQVRAQTRGQRGRREFWTLTSRDPLFRAAPETTAHADERAPSDGG